MHCNNYFVEHVERFHSRFQHLYKFIGTKEIVCIRKEFNSHRTGLGHQHGCCFIVLGHQYGRHNVMWKHFIRGDMRLGGGHHLILNKEGGALAIYMVYRRALHKFWSFQQISTSFPRPHPPPPLPLNKWWQVPQRVFIHWNIIHFPLRNNFKLSKFAKPILIY